jgi:hypothetical protein
MNGKVNVRVIRKSATLKAAQSSGHLAFLPVMGNAVSKVAMILQPVGNGHARKA